MNRVFLGILALGIFLLAGCNRRSKYAYLKDSPLPVEIEIVQVNSSAITNTYVGEIVAKSDIPLLFPLGGQLTSIQVKSGERVKEGKVIATVDNTQSKSMLESAEAVYAQAKDHTKFPEVFTVSASAA